jgi:hypothetical protein
MLICAWMTATALAGEPAVVQLDRQALQWIGGRIVRETPRFDGLPYDGPGPVKLEDASGKVWKVARPLPEHLPHTLTPSIDANASASAVERGWHTDAVGRGTLVVFPDGNRAHLAWRHRVQGLDGLWSVYVDAHRGHVIAAEAESWSARARIYDPNPVDADLQSVDLRGLHSGQKLIGEYAFSTKCTDWRINPEPFGERVCLDWSFAAKPTLQGNFFEGPSEGDLDDPFVQPNAYHHVDTIARWADERYGLRLAYPIQIFTNFPLTNAFFGDFDDDGDRDLSFGISDDGYNFGYDADVVHHEYGHALVRSLAGSMWMQADSLGNDWTPGALNEGVADAFAMVLNPDPLLAEGLGRSDRWEGGIRNHEPDRVCPDDLQSQVHRSGQVWGSMMWNMVDDALLGPELVGDIVVAAVSTWDNGTNWPDAAQSMLDAADQLVEQGLLMPDAATALGGHVQSSGMLDCERIIDLERVDAMSSVLLNLGLSDPYERIPGGVQFRHRIPAEARAIRLRVEDFTGASEGSGLAIYLRLDAPVEHEPTRIEGVGLHHAIPIAYDAVIEIDSEDAVIEVDETVLAGFDDAGVLHGSLASINRARAPLDVDYMGVVIAGDAVQGGEVLNTDPEVSGCTSVPVQSKGPWWVFLGSVLVGIRRRKG